MDPDVVHDPVFQQFVLQYELEGRKLREAVIAMRSFYLKHHTRPLDETTSEKWRGAILSEEAAARHEAVVEAAADLLRYAFEIAPFNSDALHLEELYKLKLAHRERLARGGGWGASKPGPKGIEEKVRVDDGPPVTLVIQPEHYDFTARAQRAATSSEPAIPQEEIQPSEGSNSDVDTVE